MGQGRVAPVGRNPVPVGRIAYVNGRYVPHGEACVHVEDRGYQFADGVYEVVYLTGGALLDEERHLDRLERSLGELRIAPPMGRAALRRVLREARDLFETQYLQAQLLRFGGNISRTAGFVGMERSALHRKLKQLGVNSDDRVGS